MILLCMVFFTEDNLMTRGKIMKVYVARQPIFDRKSDVYGYELLYRNNDNNAYDNSIEGSRATRDLLSDVITVFQFQNLTNKKYAFVNFTKDLLLQKIPKILNPQDIVVEILEDVIPDEDLIECIKELKERNFKIALDDYCEPGPIDALFPYADIIKVDFSLVDRKKRGELANMLLKKVPHVILLAEKIETEEEFKKAKEDGYSLFQGYFFSKPVMFTGTSLDVASSTGMRLLKEMNKNDPSYQMMADIIRTDVGMMYALLKQINTVANYRGKQISNLKDILVRMGLNEVKKWTMLKLMRTMSNDTADESVRISLIRGIFAESIAAELEWTLLKDNAFLIGMFSMIDPDISDEIIKVLEEANLFGDIKEALLGSDNELRRILMFVKSYEEGKWDDIKEIFDIQINAEHVADHYINAIQYADEIFNTMI